MRRSLQCPASFTLACLLTAGCVAGGPAPSTAPTVDSTPTRATSPNGAFISWREHRIDDESLNGGLALRGGDGLQIGDIDRDGYLDIVSVHEDSNHLRIAFGSADPDNWHLATIASGEIVAAIEDVAIGDLDGDGWLDLVAANEMAHLAVFRNPGSAEKARAGDWSGTIPSAARGRGSWLRVFIADIDGDGRPDVTAANKGESDIIDPSAPRPDRTTSLFTITGDPLDPAVWQEQVLFAHDVPNTAMPVDIDGDGDLDVLAAARLGQELFLLENRGRGPDGQVIIKTHPIAITPLDRETCRITSTAFQSQFHDMDGDSRLDLVVGVMELCGELRAPGGLPALGWLQQPRDLDAPWTYHRIGDILPDMVIGIAVGDFDGDGDPDVVTGGYSGLNILRGGYSGASRSMDDPDVTPSSTVGRIAWFANPGEPAGDWVRHDVSRRVRGMYDQFIVRDMDGDGDLDLITTRGNSGPLDGVIWLEQVRTHTPAPSMASDRPGESRALALPPADWLGHYGRTSTLAAPENR